MSVTPPGPGPAPVTHIQVTGVPSAKAGTSEIALPLIGPAAASYVTVTIPVSLATATPCTIGVVGLTQLEARAAIPSGPSVVNVSSTRTLAEPASESPSLTFALTV